MNSDLHERARRLIVLASPQKVFEGERGEEGEISSAERTWLANHLGSCGACRGFAESSQQTIRSLRAIPVTAGASLVSATKILVRQRAVELQQRQERLRIIWICSAAVTVCTALNTAVLWRGFAWASQWLSQRGGPAWIGQGLSTPFLELGFVTLLLMPALVAGIILLGRGTHLADHRGTFQS